MSNIYIQEPPTFGKVLLETTVGDIDIELWAKETPKTCRNFIQLCLEGYYNDTIFHRIIKGFIAQGGDPTGSGAGGESVYGKTFKDEFHSRLRFVRRGLIAMANAGKDDNGSQFFFTFAANPELQNKHTIFGKVVGNTLYNMLQLENCLVGQGDRPVYPPKILKTKVLNNPFPDIIPRILKKDSSNDGKRDNKSNKSKAKKDFKLLSFGDEAEEDEEEIDEISKGFKGKSKSSHDLTDDPRLSSIPAVEIKERDKRKRIKSEDDETDESDSDVEQSDMLRNPFKKRAIDVSTETSPDGIDGVPSETTNQESKNKINSNDEYQAFKKELTKNKTKVQSSTAGNSGNNLPDSAQPPLNEFDKQQDKKIAKKKASDKEAKTLALLSKFQSKLQTAREKYVAEDTNEPEIPPSEKDTGTAEDLNDAKWLAHTLHFETHEAKVKDANMKDEDTYEIFDPRNPINQRRREASKQAMRNKR